MSFIGRALLACVLIVFPILMRGNETRKRLEQKKEQLEFPIPMRGNELRCSAADPALTRHVSDPHEG